MAQTGPLSPPPESGPRNDDLPAYVSNGLIGLRVREMPLQAGMTMVSGFAGEDPRTRIEAAVPAPYPLAADLALNGVWLSDQPWAVSDLVQTYDFGTAELTSRFRYTVGSVSAGISVTTLASRTAPTVVMQEVEVLTSEPCDIGLRATVAITGLRGRLSRRTVGTPGETEPVCDGSLLWEAEGGLSSCGVALLTQLGGAQVKTGPRVEAWDTAGPVSAEYRVRSRTDRPLRLRQLASLVPSVVHGRPDEEAVRRVARARKTGFEALRARNREAWSELWKGRIVLRGASAHHQALVDAGFFYLNSSTHPASPSATSIFGLSMWHDYHHYYGHVMWDVDAFCIPPLIFSQPDAAAAMLAFRTRGLAAAGANARLSRRKGVQFPWEAGPVTCQEAVPGAGDSAAHEDHGSLHTARAFALYADVTGDGNFLREDAWPVLQGVADWLVSRLTRTERGWEILRVVGPAEVPDPPNNDAFTLMVAGQVLRRSLRAAEQLGLTAPRAWREAAENLYLPIRQDGVIAAHDDYRISEPKGATPSPLAGLFPYDHPSSAEERRKTLDFYLSHWKAYIGAPMLPALYPTWAVMAGDRALALRLFEEGYAAYDKGRFHQCLEYRPDHPDSQVDAGPFSPTWAGCCSVYCSE
jgi:trehalose/maltose hydrolase-like predicted phosphorylase